MTDEEGVVIFQADVADYLSLPIDPGSVSLVFADVLYGTGSKFEDYDDSIPENAISMTANVLRVADRVLKPGGIVIIQCDWHLNYMYRVMLERYDIFDTPASFSFLNEIIWSYNSGGAGRDRVPHKHDTLLVGAKQGAPHTFNILREPYPRDYKDRPGFNPEGRMQTSVWTVPRLSNTAKERTGYATEKPPALIARLLQTFSNPGDVIYDPCCGSGASGVAAVTEGRMFFGSDINPKAVEISRSRIAALMKSKESA